ncbi:MAG TPA: MFS transporter, partial [Casimicrobiaceae bacterium]|nr:MFS transporter [Casimicrobiaceae bacterium]
QPIVPTPRFLPLYFCFAAAYVLSYTYRTANAVISPELSSSLGISASSLGLLTSAYFVAFAAMQIPAGMLLDRYGPRRVEPVLLVIASCGALAFAASLDLAGLAFARALIGAGVSVCLMAPLKAIATWYSTEKQASLAGWIMVAGGIGVLLSTAPLATALSVFSWREIFVVLAAATFVSALCILWLVPDTPAHSRVTGWKQQWAGVKRVFGSARFWWVAPLCAVVTGSFMAIQGLWSVPWLMEVDGYTRIVAADHLLVVGIVILGGYVGLGFFASSLRRFGIGARHLLAAGFSLNIVMLALIITQALSSTYVTWALYGLGSAVNVLGFTVLGEGFPPELAARANTALNLLMFTGSFATQWGIGIVVDAARAGLGIDLASALRLAFALLFAADVLALAWFAFGWRRHALASPPARVVA